MLMNTELSFYFQFIVFWSASSWCTNNLLIERGLNPKVTFVILKLSVVQLYRSATNYEHAGTAQFSTTSKAEHIFNWILWCFEKILVLEKRSVKKICLTLQKKSKEGSSRVLKILHTFLHWLCSLLIENGLYYHHYYFEYLISLFIFADDTVKKIATVSFGHIVRLGASNVLNPVLTQTKLVLKIIAYVFLWDEMVTASGCIIGERKLLPVVCRIHNPSQ